MSTRLDQVDASRQAFKPPVAVAREERDRPTPDVLVNKSVVMEKKSVSTLDGAAPMPQDRQERIALAAYYMAERRGFEPGHEIEDWLAAETQVANEST
jgi:hypothetical protein